MMKSVRYKSSLDIYYNIDKNKLGLSWAKLKFCLVKVVYYVLVGVHYQPGRVVVGGVGGGGC